MVLVYSAGTLHIGHAHLCRGLLRPRVSVGIASPPYFFKIYFIRTRVSVCLSVYMIVYPWRPEEDTISCGVRVTGSLSCLTLFLKRAVHILNCWAISLAIHLIFFFSKSLTEPETHCSHRLDGQQAIRICLPLSAVLELQTQTSVPTFHRGSSCLHGKHFTY